jgi:hypothetical protein
MITAADLARLKALAEAVITEVPRYNNFTGQRIKTNLYRFQNACNPSTILDLIELAEKK